ncbi:MAG: hypothetical protein ACE5IB_06795 [Candidatus Geothermarchaeales archaeon]
MVERATIEFDEEMGAPAILVRDRSTLIIRDAQLTGTETPAIVIEGSARAFMKDASLGILTLAEEASLRAEDTEIRSLSLSDGARASLYGVTISEGVSMTGEAVSLTIVDTRIEPSVGAGHLAKLSVEGGSVWIRESMVYSTGPPELGSAALSETTLLVQKLTEETVLVATVSNPAP